MTNPSFPDQPTPYSSNPGASPSAAASRPPGRVLSIVGLVLAFLMPLIGLILSIVAAVKLGKTGQPKGLAIAGIIVGAILTVLGVIAIIIITTAFATLGGLCAELGPGIWEVDGVTYTCG